MTTQRTPLLVYVVVSVMLMYTGWMIQGWRKDAVIADLKTTAAQTKEKAALDLAAAERREREKEQDGANLLATRTSELQMEAADAKQEKDRFIVGVRNGTIRLSIPVTNCTASGTVRSDPGVVSGDRYQARAELTTEASESLWDIVDTGDANTRQLNKCVDAYNDIRARFNVQAN